MLSTLFSPKDTPSANFYCQIKYYTIQGHEKYASMLTVI